MNSKAAYAELRLSVFPKNAIQRILAELNMDDMKTLSSQLNVELKFKNNKTKSKSYLLNELSEVLISTKNVVNVNHQMWRR
jgi:hypothetical protein